MVLPIAAPPHFRIIAHRGASGYAPENTIFSFECLQALKNQNDTLRLGWLVHEASEEVVLKSWQAGFFQDCPRIDTLTAETVSLIHENIPEARAWRLNGKREDVIRSIQKAVDTGCDGVTIHWPDWIRHEKGR